MIAALLAVASACMFMRAYNQSTYFVRGTSTLPSLDETQDLLIAAQTGKNPVLWQALVDEYALANPRLDGKAPRADGVVNWITAICGIIATMDVRSWCLGIPKSLAGSPTVWRFRHVRELSWFSFRGQRSQRCFERHLARASAAQFIKTVGRRDKSKQGTIVSLTSIRTVLRRIFVLCGTLAKVLNDYHYKNAERSRAEAKAFKDRFAAPRSNGPRAVGDIANDMTGRQVQATPSTGPPSTPAGSAELGPLPEDPKKADLIRYSREQLGSLLGDDQ